MGFGTKEEENPASDDETTAEKQKLRTPDMAENLEMTKIPIKTRDAAYPEMIAGQSDPLLKVHHLKYLLIGFNGFLATLGLVLLSLAIWFKVDVEFTEYENTLRVDNFKAVCALFIIAALVIILVGFMGCYGAASERRWLLIGFIVVFGIIFLIEIGAVAMLWSAPYSKTISKELETQIKHQVEARDTDDRARFFTDFIQEHLKCCGATNPKEDYKDRPAPNSCNDPKTGSIFTLGCAPRMLSYLRTKAGIIGGIALPILLVQILALLAAGWLIKGIEHESRYFMS